VIFLRSTPLRFNSSHNPVVPLNSFPLIVISLTVSTRNVQSPILNESPSFLIPYRVSRWRRRRFERYDNMYGLSYGADILPTERPCISRDKIIIIFTIIVVVIVTDFSDSEPRLRRLVYRRSRGYGDDRSRLRPDFKLSRWQRRVSFYSSSRQFQYERRRMRVLVRLSVENPRSPLYASYVLYRPFRYFYEI